MVKMSQQTRSSKKEEEIVERTSPPGEIVYAAIYREGEHELKRNGGELALSGLAAGLSMGFSLVTEGLLRAHLPDAPWTILITKFGYSIGFLIVILGRQQLFTKNTLTIILPLLKKKELTLLGTVARLWAIVLFANLAGAFVFAWLLGTTSLFEEHTRQSFAAIATKAVEPSFGVILLRAILAGWLIALMIWLLPFADAARTWVIIIIAYVIGIAELPHVVAGNVESFYLVSTGALSLGNCLLHYLVPTLIGNVIGGVALVAVGAHAEFMEAGGA